jgi:ketosteroid isomerase-like protein
MSQENVEIVRRGIEQFNRQFTSTEELDLGVLAPDVVFDNSNAVFDPAIYRGHDGIREFMSVQRGMWNLQQAEAQEFIPVDEDRVIVAIQFVSIGRNGVEIAAHVAFLMTVRDGKTSQVKAFQSKADALAAVGLSDPNSTGGGK